MNVTSGFEDAEALRRGEALIGIDEAGRGCLAGPVFAAAVAGAPALLNAEARDSKTLSAARREAIERKIRESCICAVGIASLEEIARMNIRNAAALAMERAVKLLMTRLPADRAAEVITDGNHAPDYAPHLPPGSHTRTEIKGDARFITVAAASILAKTARDRYMRAAADIFPGYGWEKNAGYGTRAHREALIKYGVTALHRETFAPVRALLEEKTA